MVLWFVFCVSGKVAQIFKMFVFLPVVWAFVGWPILVYSDLEGLSIFVVLVFVFLLFRFCFCLFWLCFCFVVGLSLVLFLFCFCVFLFFVLLSSLGPKPSFFVFFSLLSFVFFSLLLIEKP